MSSIGLSSRLSTYKNGTIVNIIQPGGPPNWKINRDFNTNYHNISNNMRRSQRLTLGGNGQNVNYISRWGGITQFGNFYLGQPLNLNYLGRMEGQLGGSGAPPTNKF
jgi:hypothetical protein